MIDTKGLKRFAQFAATSSESPMLILDTAIGVKMCKKFNRLLPRVKLYYAVKALPDEKLITDIDKYVTGYDVASLAEIKQLIKLGIDSSRIKFSNPVKIPGQIEQASLLGVKSFAFQSKSELDKIAANAPHSDVYLRILVADDLSGIAFSEKFGADKNQTLALFDYAKKLNLNPVGITFHVGSQAEKHEVWTKAFDLCGQLVAELKQAGFDVNLINLGGGFPVDYKNNAGLFEKSAALINEALDNASPLQYEVIAEPGRFVSADCGVIKTSVIGLERRGGKSWLFLDTGAFQSFFEVFEFGYFPYKVYLLSEDGDIVESIKTSEYVISGPSCDSFDTMSHSLHLPTDVKVGDRLLITSAGAYTVVYGSNFNGFSVPDIHYLK